MKDLKRKIFRILLLVLGYFILLPLLLCFVALTKIPTVLGVLLWFFLPYIFCFISKKIIHSYNEAFLVWIGGLSLIFLSSLVVVAMGGV